jgi:hypothetical protein
MPDASSRPLFRAVPLVALIFGATVSCGPARSVNRAPSVDAGKVDGGDGAGPAVTDVVVGTLQSDGSPAQPVGPAPAGDASPAPSAVPPAQPAGIDAGLAPGELLEVRFTDPGTVTTDLSSAGPLDWVHFGFQGTNAINRKAGTASPLVVMSSLGAGFTGRSSAGFSRFIWSDGNPVAAARNVQSGFETGMAAAGGFQVNVQGDPERTRTVRLFVGAAQVAGRLTARFGNLGRPAYVDTSLTADGVDRNRAYTIDFRPATPESTLILEWTIDAAAGRSGNVRIQAVTLADSPP